MNAAAERPPADQATAPVRPTGWVARVAPYLALLAATLFLFADSLRIRSTTDASDLGAAFWPRAILVLLMVCTLLRVAFVARARGTATAGTATTAEPENVRKVALVLGFVVAYVWLSATIGFALATFSYLAVMAFLLGCRQRVVPIAVALLATLVILYFFVRFVYVPLPLGEGVWESFSVNLFRTLGLY